MSGTRNFVIFDDYVNFDAAGNLTLKAPERDSDMNTETTGGNECKTRDSVCKYLIHRAGQRKLPFSEREAFKPRPSKRRRRHLPAPPTLPTPGHGENFGFSNGLLLSPPARRLAARHTKRVTNYLDTSSSTLNGSVKKKEPESSPVSAADKGSADDEKRGGFVEDIPDPFAFFDQKSVKKAKTGSLPPSPAYPLTPVAPGTPGGVCTSAGSQTDGNASAGVHQGSTAEEFRYQHESSISTAQARAVMRKAVALELSGGGYNGAKGLALDVLTDLAVDYIASFGLELKNVTEEFDLEKGVHKFQLQKGSDGLGAKLHHWEPRLLMGDTEEGKFGGETRVEGKPNAVPTGRTSLHMRPSRPLADSDPGVLNKPPYLFDVNTMNSGVSAAIVGEATLMSAINAIQDVYSNIRKSQVPVCLARMGISPESLREHLHVQHLRNASGPRAPRAPR
ncbi:hypothetical protein AAMO2058_001514900 [Amorphochlora amoebiformis]